MNDEMKKGYTKYSDEELITVLKGTKPESDYAFAELYDRYGLRINAYIRTILTDRQLAEDIFQDTFIKFYQNVRGDKINGGSAIGFLITIARNLCLNAKRDTKSTVQIDDLDLPYNPGTSFEDKELADLVIMALDLVDHEYKEAMVLRFFNDLPYDEIAEILNITAARARYLVFTGKQRIKTILQPYLNETMNTK